VKIWPHRLYRHSYSIAYDFFGGYANQINHVETRLSESLNDIARKVSLADIQNISGWFTHIDAIVDSFVKHKAYPFTPQVLWELTTFKKSATKKFLEIKRDGNFDNAIEILPVMLLNISIVIASSACAIKYPNEDFINGHKHIGDACFNAGGKRLGDLKVGGVIQRELFKFFAIRETH
jgi:hypothetical protein